MNGLKELAKLVNFNIYIPEKDTDKVYCYNIFTDNIDFVEYKHFKKLECATRPYKTEEEARNYGNLFKELEVKMDKLIIQDIDKKFDKFANVRDIGLESL